MALQMNVRPEDKPKLIAIVVGILGINVFVFSKIIKGAQPAASDTASTSQTASNPVPSVATPSPTQVAQSSAKGSPGDIQTLNQDDSPPIPLTADPFRPVVSATLAPTSPPPPLATLLKQSNGVSSAKGNKRLTQSDFGSVAGILPPMKVNVPTSMSPQGITIEVELKGIIEQEQSSAVFKIGDRTLYKSEGDKLPGGILVEKVTTEGVVLRIGNQRKALAPGQSLKPSTSFLSSSEGMQNSF